MAVEDQMHVDDLMTTQTPKISQEELMRTDSVLTHDDLVVVEDPMTANDRVVPST